MSDNMIEVESVVTQSARETPVDAATLPRTPELIPMAPEVVPMAPEVVPTTPT